MFESRRKLRRRRDRLFVRLRRLGRHEQLILSILAVLIGAAAAYGAIAFRWTIGEPHVPVGDDQEAMRLLGVAREREIMLAYHRALLQARVEERGEA